MMLTLLTSKIHVYNSNIAIFDILPRKWYDDAYTHEIYFLSQCYQSILVTITKQLKVLVAQLGECGIETSMVIGSIPVKDIVDVA